MMKAKIVSKEAKILAYERFQTWIECYEWAESYIGWHGFKRLTSHRANGEVNFWVEER